MIDPKDIISLIGKTKEHKGYIQAVGARRYVACCTCGWSHKEQKTIIGAQADVWSHEIDYGCNHGDSIYAPFRILPGEMDWAIHNETYA